MHRFGILSSLPAQFPLSLPPIDQRMGIDLVLAVRPFSKHDGSAFSVHRALPGSLCARSRRLAEGFRRGSQVMAAKGGYRLPTFSHNGCLWRAPISILRQEDHFHLHSRHPDQHLQHHLHIEASTDPSCHGLAAAAAGHEFDIDEHFCCEISFLDNHNLCPSAAWGESMIDLSRARGVVAGVGVPLSLRILKRKQQVSRKSTLTSGLVEVGNSLLNAFSSMIFMMKELQSHFLHIQRHFLKQEVEGLLIQVHREMHASFLWLFQQVFSCTPDLMVLLMVLLADFTAFSMASSMPMGMVMSASAPLLATDLSAVASHMSRSGNSIHASLNSPMISSPSLSESSDQLLDDSGWIGNGGQRNNKGYSTAPNGDHEFDTSKVFSSVNNQLYSVKDGFSPEISSLQKAVIPLKDGHDNGADLLSNEQILSDDAFSSTAAALAFEEFNSEKTNVSGSSSNGSDQIARRLDSSYLAELSNCSPLVHDAAQSFVAPFTVSLEDDSHTCYDRTDLAYQYAISSDSTNSMLLANYAQFLFLVRKDHDRAEELFRRAVQCDPHDGDAISRFASFLWHVRCNVSAARKAYQAAVHADPGNSFHAADYAHFLWNSGQ